MSLMDNMPGTVNLGGFYAPTLDPIPGGIGKMLFGKKPAPAPPTFDQIVTGKAKPIASTGLANVLAQSMVLPEQVKLAEEWNPKLAAVYGKSLGALIGALAPIYQEQLAPIINQINAQGQTYQRTSDIADVQKLAPELRMAFNLLTPESASAFQRMGEIVNADLQNPTGLSPFEQRRIEQTFRSRPGYSGGLGDQMMEALAVYGGGERQKQQRLANAAALIGSGKQMYGDPMMAITGRASNTAGLVPGYAGMASQGYQQSGAGTFDPFNNAGINDVWGGLFQYDQNLKSLGAAEKANQTALIGAGIGALGNLGGAAMSMI